MPYREDESRWDDPLDDDEFDDGEEDDLESSLIECPKCGVDIYEDAVRCPLCGEYITRTHSIWQGKPLWWKVIGLLGIIAIIFIVINYALTRVAAYVERRLRERGRVTIQRGAAGPGAVGEIDTTLIDEQLHEADERALRDR